MEIQSSFRMTIISTLSFFYPTSQLNSTQFGKSSFPNIPLKYLTLTAHLIFTNLKYQNGYFMISLRYILNAKTAVHTR